jgi:DNA mismatch repair protein MutS2
VGTSLCRAGAGRHTETRGATRDKAHGLPPVPDAMDDRTLRVLEYDKVIALLAQCAVSEPGRALVRALEPATDHRTVCERLAETSEARRAVEMGQQAPLGGLRDIAPHVAQACSRGLLEPPDLLQVGDFLRCVGRLRAFLAALGDAARGLSAMATDLVPLEALEAAIGRCVTDDGGIRRSATAELSRLNDKADRLERQLRAQLEATLRREAERGTLQEPVIVFRAGRLCLPVQVGQQARFGGIVHDRSDSGATVFMEPADALGLGNMLRTTQLEIAAEVERVLRDLSGQVAGAREALLDDLATMAQVDFVLAKGKLSRSMRACEPAIVDGASVRLLGVRHPLVGEAAVPIDIWVGEGFRTLVITGPNTGGKTVTLKSVGLLSLMAQAGLHVPADPGSRVAVWRHIWADIGDEQSIEQSLSTFSGHMTQIVKIISRVDALTRRRVRAGSSERPLRALVLLDELGAGTDPTEGAALAQAILETLHEAGSVTVATTHYSDLKLYAYQREGVENASVEFDPRTLEPTYRLRIGRAGVSNALAIAQRLGLPRATVARARGFMGDQTKQFDDAIGQVEREHQRLREQAAEAEAARRDAEALRTRYAESVDEMRECQSLATQEAYEAAEAIVRGAEEQARAIIADLQRQTKQSAVTHEGRQQLARMREELVQRRSQAEAVTTSPPREVEAGPLWQVGDLVHVATLGRDGVVLDRLRDGRTAVQVGALRVDCAPDQLGQPVSPPSADATALAERMHTRKSYTVSREIDVRGMAVDEAALEIDKYLDDAVLARYPRVRIVHGKGTGMLRRGLHEFLRAHAQVREFHAGAFADGGDGVTEVALQLAGGEVGTRKHQRGP